MKALPGMVWWKAVSNTATMGTSPMTALQVFLPVILQHASGLVVAHNHPSGDPQPSAEDIEITKILVAAGETLGLPVLDHVIIGDGAYYSFVEAGALKI